MIGWRGEPGTTDEPQHMVQGGITRETLDLLSIPYLVIREDSEISEIEDFIKNINTGHSGPHALLVSSGTFEKSSSIAVLDNGKTLSRLDATTCIVDNLPENAVVVATTGKLARELNEIREERGHDGRDFLVVGGMGDGDGAAQMHLGLLGLVGATQPKNFLHVIFNNGTHESVGGQPVASPSLNYRELASSCGYRHSQKVVNIKELSRALRDNSYSDGPNLIEVDINSLSRNDLSRPKNSPLENKIKFQNYLQRGQ
jgi:phosphonopyruvate decarboxylase